MEIAWTLSTLKCEKNGQNLDKYNRINLKVCRIKKKNILGGVQDMFLDQHDSGIGTNHSNNIVEHGPKRKKNAIFK
jgi:hypothetical protein